MKKTALFIIAAILTATTFGQSIDGVPISGNVNAFVDKFKQKGYIVKKVHEFGVTMEGKLGAYPIEFYVTKTPKTNQVAKVGIYFPKRYSWKSLSEDFSNMFEILTNKYGEPDTFKSNFTSPYELGDGYELNAVALEKCEFLSIWIKDNAGIILEISKYQQLYMSYENSANMEVLKREKTMIDSSRF